jgi:hypothetical protein
MSIYIDEKEEYFDDEGNSIEVYNYRSEESWYKNGELHRIGGPALYDMNGKYWYVNGKRHRLDGPAIEYLDGSKEWYIEDRQYGTPDIDGDTMIFKEDEFFTIICYKCESTGLYKVKYYLNGREYDKIDDVPEY